ncbi:hypothetical protein [Streptomyces sp. NPDC050564]|uniref:hypothetical protein n=1 Tax=Streptomyces sp. NPDC050564 TaxID=3365631 RepID=UPI0037990D74
MSQPPRTVGDDGRLGLVGRREGRRHKDEQACEVAVGRNLHGRLTVAEGAGLDAGPNVTMVAVPDAGHLVMADRPAPVGALVARPALGRVTLVIMQLVA